MDTRKFLQAMNEVDEKYIEQADIFQPVSAEKVSPAAGFLRWAGAAAACLLLVLGVWCLRDFSPSMGSGDTPAAAGDGEGVPGGSQSQTENHVFFSIEDDQSVKEEAQSQLGSTFHIITREKSESEMELAKKQVEEKMEEAQKEEEQRNLERESFRQPAQEIAQSYADQWLANEEHPLSECFYRELYLSHINEERTSFLLSLKMVFRPEDPSDGYWMAGNTKEGTGEYEGYLTAYRMIQADLVDGEWTVTDSGTGGFPTQEYTKVDWNYKDAE